MKCETCHKDVSSDVAFCPYCGGGLRGTEENAAFEYAAFISYRHLPRDQEVAKRVQRAIETYKMPRNILPGESGVRLGKCFRDEDELAAAHSLSDRILDALRKSSALVVVCTPSTGESIWIQREVMAFIEMHGPERVFAVLADGNSKESIPDYLRVDNVLSVKEGEVSSGPLAADMRPEALDKARDEKLRLIAAIANCSFDDLKQRDRARRRKRGVLAAIASVLVIAAIAISVMLAYTARQDSLVAESRQLAAESTQLFEQGDRYGAIEKALKALPKSEASNDRPLVPEALAALEKALEILPHAGSVWQASYEIRTEAPLGLLANTLSHPSDVEESRAGAIAVSDTGGFFAVSDGDGDISTYDLLTGRKLADCIMPEEAVPLEDGLYVRTMGATEHYLAVGNGNDDGGVVAWFNADTGELIDSFRGLGCPSFSSSYGADLLSMAFPLAEGGYGAVIADLATGVVDKAEFRDVGVVSSSLSHCNTSGKRFGTNYAVFSDRLFATEIDLRESRSVSLAYASGTSLAYADGLVLVSSAEPMSSDKTLRRFALEAFDEDLELRWRYDGTFDSEMIVNNGIESFLAAEPVVCGMLEDGRKLVVSSGREVLILDVQTGELLDTLSFSQSVVGVTVYGGAGDDPGLILVACSDGNVYCKDLFEGSLDPKGDGRRLALPYPIRWAQIAYCNGYDVLLAIPADADNRIVSYRTDWTFREDADESRSFDELIDMANQVLADGGRA